MEDLIGRLQDDDISIVTIEAITDIDNPDQHIQSLLVSFVIIFWIKNVCNEIIYDIMIIQTVAWYA